MRPKALLLAGAALGLLVAALLSARLVEREVPPAPPAHAGAVESRRAGGASPLERNATPPRALARADEQALSDQGARPAPAPRAALERSPSAGSETDLDEELRLTEEAVAASRRLSAPFEEEGPAPAPARRATGPAASAHACLSAGHSCRSGAECCAGLACAGGVAGYGTPGRCEAPR